MKKSKFISFLSEISEAYKTTHQAEISFFKTNDGVYNYANHTFEKMLGMKQGSLVGKTDFDLPWADDCALFCIASDERLKKLMCPQYDILEYMYDLTVDYMPFLVVGVKRPIVSNEGSLIGISGEYRSAVNMEATEVNAFLQETRKERYYLSDNLKHYLTFSEAKFLFYWCHSPLMSIKEIGQICGVSMATSYFYSKIIKDKLYVTGKVANINDIVSKTSFLDNFSL